MQADPLRAIGHVLFLSCQCPVTTCVVIYSVITMTLSLSSLNCQSQISNQSIESSSVSICKWGIHINCFQQYCVQSEKVRWVCPTVTSLNPQYTKYQGNNNKTRQRQYRYETVLLLATRWKQKTETQKKDWDIISTTVSNEASAIHWQESDTYSGKTAKDAAETDDSATTVYWGSRQQQ